MLIDTLFMPSIQHVFFLPSARINSLLVADLLLDALAERRPGYEGGVGRALGAVHRGHQETQRSLKKMGANTKRPVENFEPSDTHERIQKLFAVIRDG